VLERIAQETGGGYFEGGKKQSLDDIFREIQDELRNQYSLGYTPDKSGPGYRAVRVLTKNKNLVVQSATGITRRNSSPASPYSRLSTSVLDLILNSGTFPP